MAPDFARNRKIKEDRVYRTLGRMSWQRVVLGVILLLYVFILSGIVSEFFLLRGSYKTADTFMVEAWMEKYKPEEYTLIKSGAAFDAGDADGACRRIRDMDIAELPAKFWEPYIALCSQLGEYYRAGEDSRADELFAAAERAASLPDDAESADTAAESPE